MMSQLKADATGKATPPFIYGRFWPSVSKLAGSNRECIEKDEHSVYCK